MKELKFNEEMQRAIDEGRKTQTRRVFDHPSFDANSREYQWVPDKFGFNHLFTDKFGSEISIQCPYGNVGDINNGVKITDVRVERLQDITRSDIRAEGLICPKELRSDDVFPNYRQWYPKAFKDLWQSIYANHPKKDWNLNPWVWVITFENVK